MHDIHFLEKFKDLLDEYIQQNRDEEYEEKKEFVKSVKPFLDELADFMNSKNISNRTAVASMVILLMMTAVKRGLEKKKIIGYLGDLYDSYEEMLKDDDDE